jgi:transglutaminase-like putative cysteine protease
VATTATLVRLALPGIAGRRALRIALVLLLQALPLMLVLHLLFPRLQGSLWGLPRDALAGRTGLSAEMQPGTINRLSRSDDVAFRAYFPEAVPTPAERYWRVLVLTRTDGRTWTRAGGLRATRGYEPEGPALPYSLAIEPSGQPWIPALEMPGAWPEDVASSRDATLTAAQPVETRQILELTSYTRYRALAIDDEERRGTLELPRTSARVETLARSLRAGRSDSETANAVLAYFRNEQFFYTLEPPLLGPDPTDEFLFDTRRGFCEHYAAAFVVLMRAAGLPARVVTGYQGGEFNPGNRSIIVRQSDAHAWAEVWLAGRGWSRVDPTAAVAPERIDYGADGLRRLLARGARPGSAAAGALQLDWLEELRRDSRLALDTAQSAWQRWVLGYDAGRQRELLARLGFGDVHGARLIGLLALLVAAVIAVYVVVTRPHPPPVDAVQRLYLVVCRRLERAGWARAAHEGPADFFARVGRARPDLSQDLPELADHYLRLRYGRRSDPDLLAEFARRVARFRPARS